MQTQTLKLPESLINKLVNLPESGMGYQIVRVILKMEYFINSFAIAY